MDIIMVSGTIKYVGIVKQSLVMSWTTAAVVSHLANSLLDQGLQQTI